MVLFSHIGWMEKYKNLILNGIMQILLCIRSPFHHEKEREGKIFFLWSPQDGWRHHPKDQMQVLMKFCKLALSKSSMKYVVDKLNNSFIVSGHSVLADKHSLTGRKVCLLSHPHDESKIWNKANLYKNVLVFLWVS